MDKVLWNCNLLNLMMTTNLSYCTGEWSFHGKTRSTQDWSATHPCGAWSNPLRLHWQGSWQRVGLSSNTNIRPDQSFGEIVFNLERSKYVLSQRQYFSATLTTGSFLSGHTNDYKAYSEWPRALAWLLSTMMALLVEAVDAQKLTWDSMVIKLQEASLTHHGYGPKLQLQFCQSNNGTEIAVRNASAEQSSKSYLLFQSSEEWMLLGPQSLKKAKA